MQPTLVILAAGMASRYGSLKQIQGFGPGGETIMEYSIYDAIRSGFGKVVFIIKEKDGKYLEIESSEEEPVLVFVPKNIPSAHLNLIDTTSRVLALADVAWRPDDNEMLNVTFDDYDWSKWKSKH